MDERAIIYAVGDDANAPVCDSSDLRLLLWAGGINYICLQVIWHHRGVSHTT